MYSATSKTDIYQLGLVLWKLARNGTFREETYDNWHSKFVPSALPDDIPEYYREIILSCRLDQPIKRPSARELLDKFPVEQPHSQMTDINIVPSDDAKVCCSGAERGCNICRIGDMKRHYHCDACGEANYDICQECFTRGLHCLDPSHFILESFTGSDECVPGETYYSSVKPSGERTVMLL